MKNVNSVGAYKVTSFVSKSLQLFATLWIIPCQTILSIGFSREEYCSALPCPPAGVILLIKVSKWCLLRLLYWQMSWAFLFIYSLLFYSTISPLVIVNLNLGYQNKNVILHIFLIFIYQIISKTEIQLSIFCVGSNRHIVLIVYNSFATS